MPRFRTQKPRPFKVRVPNEDEAVYILRDDGNLRDQGTFKGQYRGDPERCWVYILGIGDVTELTRDVVAVRDYGKGTPLLTATRRGKR